MAHTDITGQKFGKLTVIKYVYTKNKKAFWECLCDCGNITYVATGSLRSGHTLSCGCTHHKPAANRKHNMSKSSRLYNVWKELRARCNRPSHAKYCNYGARGIKVCYEWNNNFVKFYEWSLQNGYVEETLENGKKQSYDR